MVHSYNNEALSQKLEVVFDEEFNNLCIGMYNPFNSGAEIREFAKHFFELGLKLQRKYI